MQYSIVRYSEVKEHYDFRIDAEYFKPEYLKLIKSLEKLNSVKFNDILIKLTGGATPLGAKYSNIGIPFLRVQNIMPNYFNDNFICLSPQQDEIIKRSRLQENDILLTITGSYGKSAVVPTRYNNANINQHSVLMRFKVNKINVFYVSTFLNCYYGKSQSDRNVVGLSRPALDYKSIRNKFLIPMLSKDFQNEIETLVTKSYDLQDNTKSLYQEAENLLLEELGLKDWKPKHQLSYIKNYSDTQKSQRFDAEYFQPKYEKVEASLKNYPLGHSFIKSEFKHVKDVFKINPEKTYQYVEIGSIKVANSEITPENVLGSELPANAKRKLSKNQIIISKVRTYRGAISIVDNEEYIGSGAFTVLEEKTDSKLNKETLLVLLKSKPLLTWSLKSNTGTSYPVIIDNDILNLTLPLIPKNIQAQIKSNIKKSNLMRSQSKSLLSIAKKAVEMAIETSEEQASKWIDQELKNLKKTKKIKK